MKKLLSSGSPSIYSIGPAFREGEMGRNHRPEFIMIEWYRVGIDELQLIEEIKELLDSVLGSAPYTELAYREVLERAQDKTLEEDLRFSIAHCYPKVLAIPYLMLRARPPRSLR